MNLSSGITLLRKTVLNPLTLISVILFVLALWVGLDNVATTLYHRDESRWVGRAYFINELLHPGSATWSDSDLTRNQPPLGSYLMGLGLTLQGHDTTTTANRLLYDFNRSERWNQLRGRVPSLEDRQAGRRTDSVVGALVVVLVFLIAARLTNVIGGIAAGLILIPNGLHIYLASLADSDMVLTFCIAAAVLTAITIADRPTWWRVVLLGILLGLGGSAKLSPLLVAGVVGAYGVLLLLAGQAWRRRDDEQRISIGVGLMFLTVPFISFATFVLSYPYLWPDPLRRTINVFTFRDSEMTSQGDLWANLQVHGVFDVIKRIRFHLGEQYSVSAWASAQASDRFGFSWNLPWLDLALGVTGLGLLFLFACAFGMRSKYALACLIMFSQVGIIVAGMEADFDRYYEPILITFCIGTGFLIGQVVTWLASLVSAYRGRPAQEPALVPGSDGTMALAASGDPAAYGPVRAAILNRRQRATAGNTRHGAAEPDAEVNAIRTLAFGISVAIGVALAQILNAFRRSR